MQPLRPRAIGKVFDDAARHAAGDAERVDELACVEPQGRADRGGGGERAEHAGRVKARLVDEARRDQAQTACRLDANGDAEQSGSSVEAESLGGGEHRRHDHRAGVDRPTLERIVEILAVRRNAVDQRDAGAVAAPRVADRCAAPLAVDAVERGAHIVGAARRQAQAEDVEDKIVGHGAQSGG
jgi:hypothetical protein